MEAFEKAKLALRAHLLANKESIIGDLELMRKRSEGNDYINYLKNLTNSISLEFVTIEKNRTYCYDSNSTVYYSIDISDTGDTLYPPPPKNPFSYSKKDPVSASGSFFLVILQYVRSKRSSIFI
jgi:hypothetical protein